MFLSFSCWWYYFQVNQLFLAFCWGWIFAALRGGSTCRLLKRSVAGPVRLVQPCNLGFWSWMTLSIDILFFIHVCFQENISDICNFWPEKHQCFVNWFWDVYLLSCFRNWKFQLPRVSTPFDFREASSMAATFNTSGINQKNWALVGVVKKPWTCWMACDIWWPQGTICFAMVLRIMNSESCSNSLRLPVPTEQCHGASFGPRCAILALWDLPSDIQFKMATGSTRHSSYSSRRVQDMGFFSDFVTVVDVTLFKPKCINPGSPKTIHSMVFLKRSFFFGRDLESTLPGDQYF